MSAADAAAPRPARDAAAAGPPAIAVLARSLLALLLAVSLLRHHRRRRHPPRPPAAGARPLAARRSAPCARDQLVLWSIRIPRIAIAAMIGALLAMSGTIMQGLFRNPLADPALVGVSSGGAFAAAFTIVILDNAIAPNAAAHALRAAAARRLRRLAGHDAAALSHRQPRGPHIGRDLPAVRPRHRRARQCRHRPADLHGRRPAAARHHLLAARLARRRDLEQGGAAGAVRWRWRWSRCRSSPAGSTCWCSASRKRSTPASMSSG